MHRRTLIKILSSICGISAIGGCGNNSGNNSGNQFNITLPPFSEENLRSGLEALKQAYESKGMGVSKTLLPPITEPELKAKCRWFPGEMVAELITLYGWHGGQSDSISAEDPAFWFRDNIFISPESAEWEYQQMMSSYGLYSSDHELLKYSFPFAAFEGSLYVLPTKENPFLRGLKRPVISVFEGIEIYFYSLEKMLATCVEWVNHPDYTSDAFLPRETEMAIWQKHNPGIFETGA